jgi:hypothetical protein
LAPCPAGKARGRPDRGGAPPQAGFSGQDSMAHRNGAIGTAEDGALGPLPAAPPDAGGAQLPSVHAALDVIRAEMVRSADLLSDLARSLSEELLGLMRLGSDPAVDALVGRMSEILQAEDRLQQRLQDICIAVGTLQETLEADAPPPGALGALIARHLRLDEMRLAFAGDAAALEAQAFASVAPIRAGEVDLF